MDPGDRFGKLVTIKLGEPGKGRRKRWLCRCDCGSVLLVRQDHMLSGNTRSCGCSSGNYTGSRRTHGMTGTTTYVVWCRMRSRCLIESDAAYPNYGGRGITICDRWRSFENFFADMGERPDGLTIERRDNNSGYSPDNCYWATRSQQSRNKRSNVLLTCNGRSQPLAAWAEEIGINDATLWARINVYGWSVERAIKTGSKKHVRAEKYNELT